MEFTYEGLVRYGFGFQNPNHAAALFAALLPLCWGLRAYFEGRRWSCAVMPFELALYLALVLTYSRAGVLATIVAATLFYALRSEFEWPLFIERAKLTLRRKSFWISLAVFFGGALCFGALPRYFHWLFTHDDSVLNRLALWSGSLRMITENPQGVGGNSGMVYTLFYQPDSVNLIYGTLVNSFLTFVAEEGMLAAGLAFAAGAFCVALSLFAWSRMPGSKKIVAASCLSAAASMLVSGFLSTCFDLSTLNCESLNDVLQTTLLVLLLLSLTIAASSAMKFCGWRRRSLAALCGIAFSILLCGGLFVSGRIMLKGESLCKIMESQNKELWAELRPGHSPTLLLPDPKAIGIRRVIVFAKQAFPDKSLLLPLSDAATHSPLPCASALLCGRYAASLNKTEGEVFILFPAERPAFEQAPGKLKAVWLDPFDEYGVNGQWNAVAPGIVRYLRSPERGKH